LKTLKPVLEKVRAFLFHCNDSYRFVKIKDACKRHAKAVIGIYYRHGFFVLIDGEFKLKVHHGMRQVLFSPYHPRVDPQSPFWYTPLSAKKVSAMNLGSLRERTP